MGWEFSRVTNSIKNACRSSGIQLQFGELSLRFRARGDLRPRDLDFVCEFLNSWGRRRERDELRRLRESFRIFHSVASAPRDLQERRLRERLRELFLRDEDEEEEEENPQIPEDEEQQLRAEVRALLAAFPEQEFSGRAVARIFHGIGSPRFPAQVFGRDRRFWRRLLSVEFRSLARLATSEIRAWK
ncbi:ATP-dependent DNA helicase Q4-like [Ammospiza caudacuta]|uniref:ATP-dependent DNA helicase Q4-like n=1 Tax=Ammospiza caudacuta TaxID=2857398 RepID=UPI00273A0AF6|nr:ATP-dependent DNA helicase Q4-like [Ammospiza caudacuta]